MIPLDTTNTVSAATGPRSNRPEPLQLIRCVISVANTTQIDPTADFCGYNRPIFPTETPISAAEQTT